MLFYGCPFFNVRSTISYTKIKHKFSTPFSCSIASQMYLFITNLSLSMWVCAHSFQVFPIRSFVTQPMNGFKRILFSFFAFYVGVAAVECLSSNAHWLCSASTQYKNTVCRFVSCDLKVFNQHKSIFTTLLGITCKISVSKQCKVCCAALCSCCWLCPKAIRNSFSTSLMVVCVRSPQSALHTYLHSQVLFRMNFTFYVILSSRLAATGRRMRMRMCCCTALVRF